MGCLCIYLSLFLYVYVYMFGMACSGGSESVEMSQNKADDEFVPVPRQSRKRKQNEEAMDTNVVSMKRPHLPPLSGDKLLVCHVECGRGSFSMNSARVTSCHRMNVYTIISMTYIQLIQPLSKQSGVAESICIITPYPYA